MRVYIELVLFNNVAIDFLLIVCVQICRRRKVRGVRTLLTCLICAVTATYYAIAPNSAQIAIKILLAPLATLIFDSYATKTIGEQSVDKLSKRLVRWGKDYCKSLALFVVFTYLTGGIVFGLSYLLGVDLASYTTLGLCALAIGIVLIVARCVIHKTSTEKRHSCEVVLRVGKTVIRERALCDSGNTLTDSVSGLPIMILSKDAESRLPNCKIEGYVAVNTVSGEQSMPIVCIDSVDVLGKMYSAYGALSRKDFDGVDVILQYSMF